MISSENHCHCLNLMCFGCFGEAWLWYHVYTYIHHVYIMHIQSVLKHPKNFKKIVLKYTNNHCLFNPKILNKMLLVHTGRPTLFEAHYLKNWNITNKQRTTTPMINFPRRCVSVNLPIPSVHLMGKPGGQCLLAKYVKNTCGWVTI